MSNNSTESHSQEDILHQPKNTYPLNNEKTKEEIISQYKEDNTTGLDKNTFNHLEIP